MSTHYNKFIQLLEKWPIDKTKIGRDLGEHLRKQLQALIRVNDITSISDEKLNKQFESLEKLANNVHGNKYKRSSNSTATGLTGEQCRQVLSSEFLEYIKDDKGEVFSWKK